MAEPAPHVQRRNSLAASLAGVAAAAAGAGVGELTAAVLAPSASPFTVVGSALIDLAPSWAKEAAIALFGTNDKIALLIGIGIVLVGVAAAAGLLEWRWRWSGQAVMLAFGLTGVLAAMTRAGAGGLDWFPSALAGVLAAIVLRLLVARVPHTDSSQIRDAAASVPRGSALDEPGALERRRFMIWTLSAAAVGVLAGIGSSVVQAGSKAVTVIRDAIRLPAPAVAAAPVPASAELGLTGLSPVITPNSQFYRIDTALYVPQIDPADWSLRIYGMVEQEVTITWDELLALPLEESATTLTCVSNPVGGDLIGNAMWLGYPIRELLARAKPTADADMVLSRSIDGFTAGSPIEALTDERNAILAVGMNGEPLPAEHGFPVRMVVPGLYGYVSATKWVTELKVTRFDAAEAYWTTRGWGERGPIKLESRIDVPRKAQGLKAGDTVIAGVAWQQHVGVSRVEVQIDEGDWQEATLSTPISNDTWVQWMLPWNFSVGDHLIRCRATNADGETQTPEVADVLPDGATGWPERFITVFA